MGEHDIDTIDILVFLQVCMKGIKGQNSLSVCWSHKSVDVSVGFSKKKSPCFHSVSVCVCVCGGVFVVTDCSKNGVFNLRNLCFIFHCNEKA